MKPNSIPIFVYGTLSSPQVVQTLLGRTVPSEFPVARLDNHSRHPVKNYVFPGTIPNPKKRIHGCLLENLSETDMKILDWFEGDEYDRRMVQVCINRSTLADNNGKDKASSFFIDAYTYIWRPRLLQQLILDEEWNFENFCSKHLEWYLINTVRPCRKEIEELKIVE
jgi:gamma-glutamylcyclotransferase (GGCT)/AIG2-like uncharacterized protein YtfP